MKLLQKLNRQSAGDRIVGNAGLKAFHSCKLVTWQRVAWLLTGAILVCLQDSTGGCSGLCVYLIPGQDMCFMNT